MANKKTYTIEILGIKESYADVKSLQEVLSSLDDKVIKVQQTEEKAEATRKQTKSSTDALAKAQEKLANYDKAYQEELAKVNAELSANKKEISDALKVQQAQQVVDAKQLDTYKDKQTYLTALNTLIRNHSTVTDEDKDAISRMVQESAQLQAELKATDEQMKIYVRNVGNYPGAAEMVVESHKSLKQELKDIKTEMAEMLANGVSKTDEGYLKLAERAGQLKDAMGDASQDIANFASDTRGLSNAINLATSAVNAYQLYNSALQVFGFENENAAESMQKMMAVMTLLNSLQQVQNSLLENGSATARLYSKSVELIKDMLGLKKAAVEADTASTEANSVANETNSATAEANAVANETASAASETNTAVTGANTAAQGTNTAAVGTNTGAVGTNTAALGANATANQTATTATNSLTVAQKAGAVASKTLSVALRAIPLMAIIGLVMALIQNWESIWNWFKKTFPVLDTLSQKFNKFGGFMETVKAIAKGLGEGIINWLVNPFQTLAKVMGELLKGNFEAAWNAAKEGLSKQFTGFADSIRSELKGAAEDAAKDAAKVRIEKEHEVTEHQIEELEARYGADAKYTKEGRKLMEKSFQQRKALAKGNAEEERKINNERIAYERECQEHQTRAAEQGARARIKIANDAANEAKKVAEELEKARQEAIKKTDKDIEESEKLADATDAKKSKQRDEAHKQQISEYAKYSRIYLDDYGKMQNAADLTARKAEEVREIMASAITDGTESEVQMLGKMLDELEAELGYFTYTMGKDIDHMYGSLGKIDYFLAERHEYAIDQIARGAQKIKDDYKKQYDELQAGIVKMQSLLPKLVGDELKETNEKIKEAQEEQKKLIEKSKVELGQYHLEGLEIHIPVDVDFKNIAKRFSELKERLEDEGKDVPFTLTQIVDASVGVRSALKDIYDEAHKGGLNNVTETFSQLAEVLGLAKGETEDEINAFKEFVDLAASEKPFREIKEDLNAFVNMGTLDISKFGNFAKDAFDVIKTVSDETEKVIADSYKTFITQQDKVINYNKKVISNFREASKGLKLEPVMQDDVLSGILKGQIIDLDKTSERYAKLMKSYKEYESVLREGSKERTEYETAWQLKLMASYDNIRELKKIYGENSDEYKNAVRDYELLTKEKEKADEEYAMEYEKVSKQIEDLSKKQSDLMYDYIESIANRVGGVVKAIQDNVFEPLADGFGALLDFQLEKAQEALEEIEELLDKATEAREKSADRVKEINEELRADDGQNKEALQQRLAEEEVLLVQREETERALEKEKKKREYEVNVAEAKQRKFELGQKLIEGLVNTALGVTAALKYGFPLGPIFAAIIGAMGALQTGIIAKQIGQVKMPQKFAKGGRIGEQGFSRSHSQGGHRIEGTNIEVEGQEWVVNKKSSKKYNTLLNAINDDNAVEIKRQVEMLKPSTVNNYVTNNYQNQRQFAGKQIVKYATGGQLNYSEAARTVEENRDTVQLAQLIKQINFTPQVAVTDINRVNRNLTKVRDLARG